MYALGVTLFVYFVGSLVYSYKVHFFSSLRPPSVIGSIHRDEGIGGDRSHAIQRERTDGDRDVLIPASPM